MNHVHIIGRLGGDIELRHTPSGKAVCEVNIAVDDGYGENKKTAWLGTVFWDKTAEIAAKFLSKGDQVGVTGRLTQDEWEDKETGKKRTKTKITCERLYLIGGKKDGTPRPAPQSEHNAFATAVMYECLTQQKTEVISTYLALNQVREFFFFCGKREERAKLCAKPLAPNLNSPGRPPGKRVGVRHAGGVQRRAGAREKK